MSEHYLLINNINLCYETFGNQANAAIFLLMGNSAQSIMWDDRFCQKLADSNYFIVRFDYRDTGLSSCIDYDKNPYTLTDLTNDVLGLMDKLSIVKAHFVGLSMGGSIAQLLGIYHSERVLSLALMMSSPDLSIKNNAFHGVIEHDSPLSAPSSDFIQQVLELNQVQTKTNEDKIKQITANWKLANGSKALFDEHYWLALVEKAMIREARNIEACDLKFANLGNHSKAQMASPEPNLLVMDKIMVPCLIIHGKEDPIFPVDHAQFLAENIENSRLVLIDKMGHALNPVFFNQIIDELLLHFN